MQDTFREGCQSARWVHTNTVGRAWLQHTPPALRIAWSVLRLISKALGHYHPLPNSDQCVQIPSPFFRALQWSSLGEHHLLKFVTNLHVDNSFWACFCSHWSEWKSFHWLQWENNEAHNASDGKKQVVRMVPSSPLALPLTAFRQLIEVALFAAEVLYL